MVNDVPFEKIQVGDKANFSKTISEADIYTFAGITGDFNPIHINKYFAGNSRFKRRIVHGMLIASLISTVLGTALPGVNTVYLYQEVRFIDPVYIGDTLTAEVEVLEKKDEKRILTLKTTVFNHENTVVVAGQAKVMKL